MSIPFPFFRKRKKLRKESKVKAPGRKKLLYEALEPRILLSADISLAAETALQSGLTDLKTWMSDLDDFDALSQALPVINQSIGSSQDIPTL
mgnify:CR=1 FL=1